jgi:dolichol kinase
VGMVVESLPTPVNDNLTIPVVSGLILMVIQLSGVAQFA